MGKTDLIDRPMTAEENRRLKAIGVKYEARTSAGLFVALLAELASMDEWVFKTSLAEARIVDLRAAITWTADTIQSEGQCAKHEGRNALCSTCAIQRSGDRLRAALGVSGVPKQTEEES